MNTEDKLRYRLMEIEQLVERLYRHLGSPEKPPPYLELEDKPFGRYKEKQPHISIEEMLTKMLENLVLLRGIRSLARQQAKELRIREIRICTGTIGIVSVDLVVTRCH